MNTIPVLYKQLQRYFDIAFYLRFILILVGLCYFNSLYQGLIFPEGKIYSAFLAEYFNYLSGLIKLIIGTSNIIAHCFNMQSSVINSNTLKTISGVSVYMAPQCIGLGVMSFWLSYVVAHSIKIQQKIIWGLAGIVAIMFINSFRIALILLALTNKWKQIAYADHHKVFNIVSYALILLLMALFYKATKGNVTNPTS